MQQLLHRTHLASCLELVAVWKRGEAQGGQQGLDPHWAGAVPGT